MCEGWRQSDWYQGATRQILFGECCCEDACAEGCDAALKLIIIQY